LLDQFFFFVKFKKLLRPGRIIPEIKSCGMNRTVADFEIGARYNAAKGNKKWIMAENILG